MHLHWMLLIKRIALSLAFVLFRLASIPSGQTLAEIGDPHALPIIANASTVAKK
jgi:hypothetical protein